MNDDKLNMLRCANERAKFELELARQRSLLITNKLHGILNQSSLILVVLTGLTGFGGFDFINNICPIIAIQMKVGMCITIVCLIAALILSVVGLKPHAINYPDLDPIELEKIMSETYTESELLKRNIQDYESSQKMTNQQYSSIVNILRYSHILLSISICLLGVISLMLILLT